MNELIKLNSSFNDYVFYEKPHIYYYKDNKVIRSVTALVHEFETEFDSRYWLPIKAKQAGITEKQLQEQWTLKANISTNKGTAFHLYAENLLSNKKFDNQLLEAQKLGIKNIVQDKLNIIYPMFDKFNADIKGKLIAIKSEVVVGVSNIVAGMIDQIFWNVKDNELQIWDWKTNKQIKFENSYQNFKEPLNHLEQCEINTYSLQLNIYKQILAIAGINIGKCFIGWFFEENETYKIYQCKDFKQEANKLLSEIKDKEV